MSQTNAHRTSRFLTYCVARALLVPALAGCGSDAPQNGSVSSTPAATAVPTTEQPRVALTRIDPPSGPGAMAPTLIASGDALIATWLEPTANAAPDAKSRTQFQVKTSTLHEDRWSSPVSVSGGGGIFANWADVPIIGRAGDGALVTSWASVSGPGPYSYGVALARSTDNGASWSALGLVHSDRSRTEHGFVSMVEDGADVRAFWLDGRNTATRPGKAAGAMTLRTARIGASIRDEELLDDRICDCCGTAAAQTDAGPIVVYRNRTREEIRDIWIVRRAGDGWTEPRPVHRDEWKIGGCPVNGPAIAASGARVVVAWYTYAADRPSVRVAFSADGGASFADPIEVDGPRGRRAPIGRVGVQLVGADEAVVSWLTSERERAAVRLRRVAADARLGDEVVVATTRAGRASGFPRLGRMADDFVVLWTDLGEASTIRGVKLPVDSLPALATPSADQARVAAMRAGPQPGDALPPLSVTTLAGDETSLASLRGTPVLLNIWATWCQPCRRELPELNKLADEFEPRGLRVIGLSVDQERSREDLERFAKQRTISYPIWHDAKDTASIALGVGILPATYVVDRDGRLVWRHSGAVTASDPALRQALERAVAR